MFVNICCFDSSQLYYYLCPFFNDPFNGVTMLPTKNHKSSFLLMKFFVYVTVVTIDNDRALSINKNTETYLYLAEFA